MTATLIDFTAVNGFGEPIEFEGTCPGCTGVYPLDKRGCLPEHRVAGGRLDRPRCEQSGAIALDPRRRKHFYVEGVRFL